MRQVSPDPELVALVNISDVQQQVLGVDWRGIHSIRPGLKTTHGGTISCLMDANQAAGERPSVVLMQHVSAKRTAVHKHHMFRLCSRAEGQRVLDLMIAEGLKAREAFERVTGRHAPQPPPDQTLSTEGRTFGQVFIDGRWLYLEADASLQPQPIEIAMGVWRRVYRTFWENHRDIPEWSLKMTRRVYATAHLVPVERQCDIWTRPWWSPWGRIWLAWKTRHVAP